MVYRNRHRHIQKWAYISPRIGYPEAKLIKLGAMHTGDWNQDIRCKKHEKDTLFNQVVLYQGMFYT
jgi:hypothetical protein